MDISPLKSATHWLYFSAKDHPEIGLPKVGHKGKDSNFFGTPKFNTGYAAYERTFPKGRKVWYDISPHYSNAFKTTAKQIFEYNPGVKITCLVRDPVDRAVSHYRYYFKDRYKSGSIPSFEKALRSNTHGMFQWGLVGSCLERFLEFFPREQLFLVRFEAFRKDQASFLRGLFHFLDIDPNVKPKVLDYAHWKRISEQKYYAGEKVKREMKIGNTDFAR